MKIKSNRSNKLRSAIRLGLTVLFICGTGAPAVFAETLTIITQRDYDNNASNIKYTGYLFPLSSTSGNTVVVGQTDGGTVPVFSGGTTVNGGYNKWTSADTNNNTLIINSGSGIGSSANTGAIGVFGGNTWYSNANNNTVIINGGMLGGSNCNILGGYSQGTGNANNNTITINGGTINGTTGKAYIEGGNSGYLATGTAANNNTVTINGGTISNASIEGGESGYATGKDMSAVTNNNTVTINSGTLSNVTIEGAEGDNGSSDANSVIINGGIINGTKNTIYGALSLTKATNNTVTINGGTISNAVIEGAQSEQNIAANNSVVINSGTLNGNSIVCGAYGYTKASDNSVMITGGTVSGRIYAGYAANKNVTDNTLTIDPLHTMDISGASLYGSNASHDQDSSGNQLGNTLDVYQKSITAKNVSNFSNINFYLPSSIQNGDTVLTLTNSAGTDVSYSTVSAYVPGNANLSPGEKIYLLTNANGVTTANTKYSTNASLTQGVSLDYSTYMGKEGSNSIVLELTGAKIKPQTKSLVETRTAEIEFLNSGMNLASGMVMDDDLSTAEGTYVPFAATSGDVMRYQTGSHVDIRGDHTIVGLSRKIDKKDGAVYIAPFIEGGWGRYTSHMGDITANGNLNYYGFGVLAHRQHDSGLYYEGSLHYGRVQSTYNSDDLEGASSEHYDLTTPYYAVYAGIGKEKKSENGNRINIYGKYYYTREQGDTTTLKSGETYDFNDVTSNRVRLGTRYTHAYGSRGETYAGIAYEYEFSGSADATYKGYKTPDSRLKGGSGMLEVGYKILPTKDRPVSLDITLTGWAGRQSGLIPEATVKWHF